ncbi:unnamed protein product, partial [Timema podura]|nr:unnamed protein product [Timema podura]
GANVSLVKSSIIDCKEYGIKFETNRCSKVNLKPKIGAIDLLERWRRYHSATAFSRTT